MRIILSSEINGTARPAGRLLDRPRELLQHGLPLRLEAGVPVLPDATRANAIDKRLFDLVVASLALIALAPALLCLALAIKLSSPGPVLFRQRRVGRGGVPFTIYKFRTMLEEAADPTGVRQVDADDPGITPIGRLMRAKSLDELPQLLNVLRGEMSLIGPRPHAVGMEACGVPYEVLVPYYHLRHAVRPGLSGWAQANGLRGPTLDERRARSRVDHDLAYIQNRSLLLDLKVIALTIKQEFLTGSGG